MKRRIAMILLLLIGGAIVNVAVAWALALWQWPPYPEVFPAPPSSWPDIDARTPTRVLPNDEQNWMRRRQLDDWIDEVRYRDENSTTGMRVVMYARTLEEYWQGGAIWRIDCGWPMLSFGGLRDERGAFVIVPYPVNWLGFIVNTFFYLTVIVLLWLNPFTVRQLIRRRRRRRGQCEKCAYPIGVSPVCTECGAAVRLRSAGAQRM